MTKGLGYAPGAGKAKTIATNTDFNPFLNYLNICVFLQLFDFYNNDINCKRK